MISAFPKIFAIGTDYVRDIFQGEVEITEKVDGSQFGFGRTGGQLYIRSKGAQLYIDNPEKMFAEGIAYIDEIQHRIPDGMVFYAEYLKKPKHNTLCYERIPANHLMLFGVMDASKKFDTDLSEWAERLGIEAVPVIYRGEIAGAADLQVLMGRKSALGGADIEGIVVKNYNKPFLLGGQPIPLMGGKFVSEAFKEVHRERWGAEETGKSRMETFFESFRTEARWEKAVQRLAEAGRLTNEPRDIGALIKEVHSDIEAEEKVDVMNFLWREFSSELKRRSTAGMPEWYKQRLVSRSFSTEAA